MSNLSDFTGGGGGSSVQLGEVVTFAANKGGTFIDPESGFEFMAEGLVLRNDGNYDPLFNSFTNLFAFQSKETLFSFDVYSSRDNYRIRLSYNDSGECAVFTFSFYDGIEYRIGYRLFNLIDGTESNNLNLSGIDGGSDFQRFTWVESAQIFVCYALDGSSNIKLYRYTLTTNGVFSSEIIYQDSGETAGSLGGDGTIGNYSAFKVQTGTREYIYVIRESDGTVIFNHPMDGNHSYLAEVNGDIYVSFENNYDNYEVVKSTNGGDSFTTIETNNYTRMISIEGEFIEIGGNYIRVDNTAYKVNDLNDATNQTALGFSGTPFRGSSVLMVINSNNTTVNATSDGVTWITYETPMIIALPYESHGNFFIPTVDGIFSSPDGLSLGFPFYKSRIVTHSTDDLKIRAVSDNQLNIFTSSQTDFELGYFGDNNGDYISVEITKYLFDGFAIQNPSPHFANYVRIK